MTSIKKMAERYVFLCEQTLLGDPVSLPITKHYLRALELLGQCLKEESHRADQRLRVSLTEFLKEADGDNGK